MLAILVCKISITPAAWWAPSLVFGFTTLRRGGRRLWYLDLLLCGVVGAVFGVWIYYYAPWWAPSVGFCSLDIQLNLIVVGAVAWILFF